MSILNISSTDPKINIAEKAPSESLSKDIKPEIKPIAIDEKFNDQISLTKNKTIQATVIKVEDNTQTLQLDNGKQIQVKLPIELKALDTVYLKVENSQIVDIQVKDLVQSLNLNKADFNSIVKLLNFNNASNLLNNNQLNLDLSSLNNLDSSIKAVLLDTLSLKLNLNKSALEFISNLSNNKIMPEQASLDLLNLNITTSNSTNTNNVKNIEFSEQALKLLVNAISKISNNDSELNLKVIKQSNINSVQTALNDDIKLDLQLSKPQEILSKFISIKPEPNNTSFALKTDSNNTIESIKINPETFKNIINTLKTEFANTLQENKTVLNNLNYANSLNKPIEKNIELPIIINNNKAIIPSLENLTIKLPIQSADTTQVNNTQEPAKLIIKQEQNNKIEVLINNSKQTISLENIDIQTNSKAVNQVLENLIQQSNISQISNDKIILKSPSMFEILLNLKSSVNNNSAIKFILNDDNNLVLKTENNIQVNQQQEQALSQINKSSIPNLAKDFSMPLSLILTSFIVSSSSKNSDKDADIFSLILETIPQAYKPKLQASSNQNDALRYFTFPYYQEENILKQGQMTYQSYHDKQEGDVHNLAIKVEFSKLGEVMLKIKNINKTISVNIFTQKQLSTTDESLLNKVCQQSIDKSGFLGTVLIKKSESMQMPLLNSEKIVYSGINLEI